MKKTFNWQVFLGIILIALSVLVYLIHFAIFRDARHIFIYLIGDIAFVFFEVLLVALVLHQLLSFREKRSMLNKLNMVIGAFFSEAGRALLKVFSSFDPEVSGIAELVHRKDLRNLPAADYDHLAGDIKRAYHQLISQWVDYLRHLKSNYPYLFSLAVRTNPFDANASVELK